MDDMNTIFSDQTWLFVTIALLIIILIFTKYYSNRRIKRREKLDNPRTDAVNSTNYNKHRTGMDDHRTKIVNREDAKNAINDIDQSDDLPTDEEFYDIKDDVDKKI